MKDQRWARIKIFVDNALTLSGKERETYLKTICRNHPDICAEINELLQLIEEAEDRQFMNSLREQRQELIAELFNEFNNPVVENKFIGSTIGPYRLTEQVGSGGMGVVFKAERDDGEFHHTVAIKLMKKGMDSRENIRRFMVEREILASLQHPNIAQLHDGGVTKEGTPYFIMEYVEGTRIDHYCNSKKLTISQRLNLFKKICTAVQYAHNKLVVHRDLKAQNIYVSSEGNVKILDFGIAKLLDPGLAKVALLKTRPGRNRWTPQYAAPEQIKGEEITTKTDIYALGVLLHILLTDTYPLNLEEKSLAEIKESIKNNSPSSLSLSFAHHPSPKECASYRRSTIPKLKKTFRGDLDALVLKAIRKDPEYRYISVNQLLEDIERYNAQIPLIARKGTWKYRASKFMHRYKTGLATVAIFLITAISFTFFYTWRISQERDRAEVQAHKAEQVTEFMMELFEANEPGKTAGKTITARELLERGIQRTEELSNQPRVLAEMLYVIGQVYQYLGLFEEAENLLEKSLSIRKRVLGPHHQNVADIQLHLAILRYTMGNLETDSLFHAAISTYRRHLKPDNPRIAHALTNQAIAQRAKGNYVTAELLFRKVLESFPNEKKKPSPSISVALTYLGKLLILQGEYQEADTLLLDALNIRRKLSGYRHPVYANILDARGELFLARGDPNEAEQIFREALSIRRKLFRDGHPDIAASFSNLGNTMRIQERYNEAEQLLQKALSIYRKSFGENSIDVAKVLQYLGSTYLAWDKLDLADQFYQESLTIWRYHSRRKNHPYLAVLLIEIAGLRMKQGEVKDAEPALREALYIRSKIFPDGDRRIANAQMLLGSCLAKLGRYEEAEPLLVASYVRFKEKHGSQTSRAQEILKQLIILYKKWGKPEKTKILKNELRVTGNKHN